MAESLTFEQAREMTANEVGGVDDSGMDEVLQENTDVSNTPETPVISPEAEQALRAAEAATAMAQQRQQEMMQVQQQLQALQEQNQQLQAAIGQISARNEQNIVEETMQMPSLDFSSLMYADPETVAAKQREFSEAMLAAAEQRTMKKLEPFLQQAQGLARQNERSRIVSELSASSELPGFSQMLPQIEQILQNNKELEGEDLGRAYVTGYAIAKGVNAMAEPPMTADKFLELYQQNPEFAQAIEKQRLQKAQGATSTPPLMAGGGNANAAVSLPNEPKTLSEARELTRKMLGI